MNWERSLTMALLVAVAMQPNAWAQDHRNIELLSQVTSEQWGNLLAVSLDGEYAYVLEENTGVRVVDVSRPVSPVQVGLYASNAATWDVSVQNGVGCVAAGDAGIIILDCSDPTHPTETAQIREVGNARGVTVLGDFIYVAAGGDGLSIVSLNPPNNPHLTGYIGLGDFALAVAVDGDYAYIADRAGGLQIIDVSEPRSPRNVSTLAAQGETRDIAYQDGFVYLAETQAVSQVDVSDPQHPTRTASVNVHGAAVSIAVSGNNLYSSQTNYYLYIHDLNNSLAEVGHDAYPAHGLEVMGNFAYSAVGGSIGFRVVNIQNPQVPIEVGRCGSRLEFNSVAYSNNHAFLETYPIGVMSYDVRDPAQATLVWQNVTGKIINGRDVIALGNCLFAADDSSDNSHLRIADISDPVNPRWLGRANLVEYPLRLALGLNTVYCTNNHYSFSEIIDVSDPTHPGAAVRLWDGNNAGNQIDLRVKGGYAYMATEDAGLVVRDISDMMEVRTVATFQPGSPIFGLELIDNPLYLSCNDGLHVVDIRNIDQIGEIGFIRLPGTPTRLVLAGEYAFVVCSGAGLRVVNIGDPHNMEETGFFDTPGSALGITVHDSIAYIADDDYFLILDCRLAMNNVAPVWAQHPDSVRGHTGHLLNFDIVATDLNNDSLTLSMDRRGLPHEAHFTDFHDETGTFSWLPANDQTGHYEPLFIVSDGRLSDSLVIPIDILNENGIVEPALNVVSDFAITSVSPNPFNSSTTIEYSLPHPGRYALSVVDITGREVARLSEGWKAAGSYRAIWNAGETSAGVYTVKMEAGGFGSVRTIVLLK